MTPSTGFAWTPGPEDVELANVTRLMRAHGIDSLKELTARSVRVRITDVYGVLELELQPGAYEWRFVGSDGSVLDHGSGSCHR